MPHITLEPDKIDILYGMTLQDLRCCELALKDCTLRFRTIGGDHGEAADRLEVAFARVEQARRCAEKTAAEEEVNRLGVKGTWALIQP